MDLKVINAVIDQLESERGVPREKAIEAIEHALASAYKKEYGKRGQIIRADFDPESGTVQFNQIKIVVDESTAVMPEEDREDDDDDRVRFNPEHHILLEDAKKIKKDAELDDELVFPLEEKDDYGRISAQTAKQVIIQKIREAEKVSVHNEFEDKQGEIVSGTVQRIERGNVYVDLGRATGILPYDEQIPGERFRQGERIRAYLMRVDESSRGVFLRLSRSAPEFLHALFELEAPEVASGVVEIKAIAREAGSRSKVAVYSHDEYIDPVGSLVGQRGVRVSTVMSELGGEKIDIIEWHENIDHFIEESISPAEALRVTIDEDVKKATIEVAPDQQSLAIGKGGQNARLAAKLTGYTIDIQSIEGETVEEETPDGGEGEVIKEDDIEKLSDDDEKVAEDDQEGENSAPSDDNPTSDEDEDDDTHTADAKEAESAEEDVAEDENGTNDVDDTTEEDASEETEDEDEK